MIPGAVFTSAPIYFRTQFYNAEWRFGGCRPAFGKEEGVNIVACVKQVPDTEAQIKVKGDGSGIEEGGIKWVMNPYDEFGVEEALKLKEKLGGDVTIVSIGPARAMETIRTALAMGVEKGIHIDDPALYNADAYAHCRSACCCQQRHDLMTSSFSVDSARLTMIPGQIGSILAELLGIPQVTMVSKLEISGASAKAVRPIEGAQLVIETALPCVIDHGDQGAE